MPDFNVKVKTTHEGDGAKQATKDLKELKAEAKEFEKQTGLVGTVLDKLNGKLKSLAFGTAFGAAFGLLSTLLQKAWTDIKAITDLLPFFEKKTDEATDSLAAAI